MGLFMCYIIGKPEAEGIFFTRMLYSCLVYAGFLNTEPFSRPLPDREQRLHRTAVGQAAKLGSRPAGSRTGSPLALHKEPSRFVAPHTGRVD